MAFLTNLAYTFTLPQTVQPSGSILQASGLTMESLIRRKLKSQYPHMKKYLLFDPQLYLSGLDATQSPGHCTKLATYPWFEIPGITKYDSDLQKQSDWKKELEKHITTIWTRKPPNDTSKVLNAVQYCIDFQRRLECDAIILPSPLTFDPATDYSNELMWLDLALDYIKSNKIDDIPIYATVALSDICVRYAEPLSNLLLQMILDAVSARDINGVYLVIEQSSEPAGTRHFSNTRSLESALHLTHIFTHDCGIDVGVNYFGFYGLALEAAGAKFWSSGWYKSLYRLRLADKLAGGRAYPSYWSSVAAVDVHLQNDFDTLQNKGMIDSIATYTSASEGLLKAAKQNIPVSMVPAWEYRHSNVTATQEHYLLSAVQAEATHTNYVGKNRLDYVENWLIKANDQAQKIATVLGPMSFTKTDYIRAWLDAFQTYRRDHNN